MKRELLITAAEELNTVLGLDPGIDVELDDEEMIAVIKKDVLPLIDPKEDEFTKPTQKVIDELEADDEPEEDDQEEEDEGLEEAEEVEEAEELPLEDEVKALDMLADAKALVKSNNAFKALRGTLASYKVLSSLRADMLNELGEGEPEPEKKAPIKEAKPLPGKAPAEKKAPVVKKEKGKKGLGIISTIVSMVENAGEDGVSKEEILQHLVETFPDKASTSMKATINVQLPGRISKEKFSVEKLANGNFKKAKK